VVTDTDHFQTSLLNLKPLAINSGRLPTQILAGMRIPKVLAGMRGTEW
tara:strand:+ start:109851 stop:109994 length:144 start_codon:yes stop_codon:yes gene_type:complete